MPLIFLQLAGCSDYAISFFGSSLESVYTSQEFPLFRLMLTVTIGMHIGDDLSDG